jgi:hypothetical protein
MQPPDIATHAAISNVVMNHEGHQGHEGNEEITLVFVLFVFFVVNIGISVNTITAQGSRRDIETELLDGNLSAKLA